MPTTPRRQGRNDRGSSAINVTIAGIVSNDRIGKIAEIAKRHPGIRLEAGITAGQKTWTGCWKPGGDHNMPSFEHLREMLAACRVHGLGSAVHLKDCYADMARTEEHRIIAELANGASRIQIEDTGYDYDAIETIQAAVDLPTVVRSWSGFVKDPPSTKLEYLHTDLGQSVEVGTSYPKPWVNVRCGYSGRAVNADPADAMTQMLAIGNNSGWLEIERRAIAANDTEIDWSKLEKLLDVLQRAAEAPRTVDCEDHVSTESTKRRIKRREKRRAESAARSTQPGPGYGGAAASNTAAAPYANGTGRCLETRDRGPPD